MSNEVDFPTIRPLPLPVQPFKRIENGYTEETAGKFLLLPLSSFFLDDVPNKGADVLAQQLAKRKKLAEEAAEVQKKILEATRQVPPPAGAAPTGDKRLPVGFSNAQQTSSSNLPPRTTTPAAFREIATTIPDDIDLRTMTVVTSTPEIRPTTFHPKLTLDEDVTRPPFRGQVTEIDPDVDPGENCDFFQIFSLAWGLGHRLSL